MFKVISEIIFPANLLTGAKHQKQNIVQPRTTKKEPKQTNHATKLLIYA